MLKEVDYTCNEIYTVNSLNYTYDTAYYYLLFLFVGASNFTLLLEFLLLLITTTSTRYLI